MGGIDVHMYAYCTRIPHTAHPPYCEVRREIPFFSSLGFQL